MSGASDNHVQLKFAMLGPFRLEWQNRHFQHHLGGPTLEGLAYLAFNANQPVRKEKIAAMLWPDRTDKSSRGLLSTALWRIRCCLKPIRYLALTTDAGCVNLTLPHHPHVDAVELEAAVMAAHAAAQSANSFRLPDCKRQALACIIGTDDREFLEGMTADWILAERERIFNLQVRGLILLMNDLSERGLFEEALMIGRRILHLDPFRECVHRLVMWLYVLAGQQGNAIRQFNQYEANLKQELGIAPMIETVMLKEHILDPQAVLTGGDSCNQTPFKPTAPASLFDRIHEVEQSRQNVLSLLNTSSMV